MKKKWLIAILVAVLVSILPAVSAAQILIPSSIKAIKDRSFYGDESITEVELPEGLEHIGTKAFARTGLKTVLMPSTIRFIAPDAFDQCEGLVIQLLEKNEYVEQWCTENNVPFQYLIASKLQIGVEKTTMIVGDQAIISAELSLPDTLTEPVLLTWSTSNAKVAKVDQFGVVKAIARGTATITCEATVNGMQVSSNAVTIKVERPSTAALEITSVTHDRSFYRVGETVTLSVQTNESTQELTYNYYLSLDGSATAAQSIRGTASSTAQFALGSGTWTATVTVTDQRGRAAEYTTDAFEVVMPDEIEYQVIVTADKTDALPNNSVTWTAVVEQMTARSAGSVETAQISAWKFNVLRNGRSFIQKTVTDSNSITIELTLPGEYEAEVEAVEASGYAYTGVSSVTTVWENKIGEIVSPVLSGGDGFATLGETASASVQMANAAFSIRWGKVELAHHYRVILQQKNGSTWEEKARMDEIRTDNAGIPAELFYDQTVTTSYRLAVQAVGKNDSALKWYYFSVPAIDRTVGIMMNGTKKTAINWYHPWYEETTRVFTIASEQSCFVTESPSWVRYDVEGDRLTVTILRLTVNSERTGQLKISNGTNTAVINLVQTRKSQTIAVENTGVLSETEANPGNLFSDSSIRLDSETFTGYAAYRVYEKTSTGYDKLIGTRVTSKYNFSLNMNLTAGKQYKVCFYPLLSESLDDHDLEHLPCSVYYGDCTGTFLTINGGTAAVLDYDCFSSTKNRVYVNSNRAVTVTFDSSWLSCTYSSKDDYYHISCTANTTENDRTGHVTFTAGGKSVVLTVNQPSELKMVYPTNLSTSKSSPTLLPANQFNFVAKSLTFSITNVAGGSKATV